MPCKVPDFCQILEVSGCCQKYFPRGSPEDAGEYIRLPFRFLWVIDALEDLILMQNASRSAQIVIVFSGDDAHDHCTHFSRRQIHILCNADFSATSQYLPGLPFSTSLSTFHPCQYGLTSFYLGHPMTLSRTGRQSEFICIFVYIYDS